MELIKTDLLADLNETQREAVTHFDSHLRIVAGAGSGKTRVLTRKVAHLINDIGIPPKRILAMTFSNKATNDMKQRIVQYCSKSKKELNIFTFHSFCARVLRKHIRALGFRPDFTIIDDKDKEQVLSDIYTRLQISSHDISYKNMIEYISYAKTREIFTGHELAEERGETIDDIVPKVFQEYLNDVILKGALDFDDLISLTKLLFSTHPEIADEYREQFRYVLIDEFQDISRVQYEVFKVIIGPKTVATIVGDPDQTIYNWRGADVNLILDFDKDFENTKTVVLDTNYRSTNTILDAANELISHNKNRLDKKLKSANTNRENEPEIEYYHGFSPEAEARWVVQKINELKKQKTQLKDIAILYRTNYYSRPFEEALIEENINHKIFNGVKFFQRAEIKDTIAFLRTIAEQKDIAFERIINVPNRGIGEKTLQKLRDYAKSINKSLFRTLHENIKELPIPKSKIKEVIFPLMKTLIKYCKALRTNKIWLTLNMLLEEIGYYKHIENNENLRGSAVDNVRELINSIKTWEETKGNQNKTVIDYLNMVSLWTIQDDYDNVPNYVSMMAVHSAKGLEFENVFIVGLSEGIFPHDNVLLSSKSSKEKKKKFAKKGTYDTDIEDERRLVYVAVTRTKQKLFLSDSRGKLLGTSEEKRPSRFISEMGINLNDTIIGYNERVKRIGFDDENKEIHNTKIVVGDIISHTTFGEGEVVEVTSDEIVVKFIKDNETKTLNKNHSSFQVVVPQVVVTSQK
ncbi:UvrD-helicase domain-containing protein [Mycoplasma sp. Pen4]|uniref:ATP-dependent helicase n=1 Tax=Mycoplasma sp. Pen4 TaxID=640330 RepID=UPI0016540317|nr:UvrD-helicase domain-containing protein [Mycoplasma sp. Pen4]QNM93750.1 UvrD-helicase domain-containing protein [Mycoplasma sp. Pen4]